MRTTNSSPAPELAGLPAGPAEHRHLGGGPVPGWPLPVSISSDGRHRAVYDLRPVGSGAAWPEPGGESPVPVAGLDLLAGSWGRSPGRTGFLRAVQGSGTPHVPPADERDHRPAQYDAGPGRKVRRSHAPMAHAGPVVGHQAAGGSRTGQPGALAASLAAGRPARCPPSGRLAWFHRRCASGCGSAPRPLTRTNGETRNGGPCSSGSGRRCSG